MSLDYESLDKGTPIDGMSVPALTRVTLARFAGALDQYNPMHLDDRVATAAGKTSVFAPSDLVMAYVARVVQKFFGGVVLRRYGLRMLKLVWPGDVLTCRGVVIDKRVENGEHIVDADVWADNQRGETVAKGRVLAVVPPSVRKGLSRAELSMGVVYPGPGKPRKAGAAKKTAKKATKKVAKKTTKKVAKRK